MRSALLAQPAGRRVTLSWMLKGLGATAADRKLSHRAVDPGWIEKEGQGQDVIKDSPLEGLFYVQTSGCCVVPTELRYNTQQRGLSFRIHSYSYSNRQFY